MAQDSRSPPRARTRHHERDNGYSRRGGRDREDMNDRLAPYGRRDRDDGWGDRDRERLRRDYGARDNRRPYDDRERNRERERDRERYRDSARYTDRGESSRRSASPRRSRPRSAKDQSRSHSRSQSPSAVDKSKPNFAPSGLLAAATNTVKAADGTSTVLKYNEPPEARKPILGWRLYVFKGSEQVGVFAYSISLSRSPLELLTEQSYFTFTVRVLIFLEETKLLRT